MKLVLRNFVYFCVIHNALLINAMPTPAQYADRANQLMAAKSQNCPLTAEIYELHRDDFLTEPGVEIEMISRNDAKNQVAKISGGLKVNLYRNLWRVFGLCLKDACELSIGITIQLSPFAWLPSLFHPLLKILPSYQRSFHQVVKSCCTTTLTMLGVAGFFCTLAAVLTFKEIPKCAEGLRYDCDNRMKSQGREYTPSYPEHYSYQPDYTGGWLIKLPHHPLLRIHSAKIKIQTLNPPVADCPWKHPKWFRQFLETSGQFKEDGFEQIQSRSFDLDLRNEKQLKWCILFVRGNHAFDLSLCDKNLFDVKFEFIVKPPHKSLQYKTSPNKICTFPIMFQSFSEMLKTFERNEWTDPIHLPEPVTPHDSEIIELISHLCLSMGVSDQVLRKSDSFKSRMLQLIDFFQMEEGICPFMQRPSTNTC